MDKKNVLNIEKIFAFCQILIGYKMLKCMVCSIHIDCIKSKVTYTLITTPTW